MPAVLGCWPATSSERQRSRSAARRRDAPPPEGILPPAARWRRTTARGGGRWDVEAHLEALPARVTVTLNGRPVIIRAWRRRVTGLGGAAVPVYFLDTDVEENTPDNRALSHFLYGGDTAYRLAQEAVLGIGGVRMLRALGYDHVGRFHLNEGHSALLALELVSERLRGAGRTGAREDDIDAVRQVRVALCADR